MEDQIVKLIITILALFIVLYYMSKGVLNMFSNKWNSTSINTDTISSIFGTA
jgi:hypothetical protein